LVVWLEPLNAVYEEKNSTIRCTFPCGQTGRSTTSKTAFAPHAVQKYDRNSRDMGHWFTGSLVQECAHEK
jgi:hypothetical protein